MYTCLLRATELTQASNEIFLRTVLALPGTWSPFLGAKMLPGMASIAPEMTKAVLGLVLIGPRSIEAPRKAHNALRTSSVNMLRAWFSRP
jgi:hypothetical protein